MVKVKIYDILTRVKDVVDIEDDKEYKRVTIRLYHKGVCIRDIEVGTNIGTKRQFLVKPGQFIMSRIDARNGAFGIIPRELDGAVVTNDFITFEVNRNLVNVEYFELFSQTDGFLQKCIEGSTGTTNRKRLSEELFVNFEINLPDKSEQDDIVNRYKNIKSKLNIVLGEIEYQKSICQQIRQSILQQAIQGRLVTQNSEDESARILLEKIAEEKERLIREKRIKREKSLSPINIEEIPYQLPEGWEWVRLTDIGELARGKSKHRPRNDEILFTNGYYPFVQTGDVAKSNGLITKCSSFYNEVGLKQSRLWSKGTLCITIAANIADTGILGIDACFPDSVVGFVPFKPIKSARYVEYFLKVAKADLIKFAPSTAQKNINLGILYELIVPLPPLKELNRIVNKVDQLMLLCDELEEKTYKSKSGAELLMQSILQEIFKNN